MVRSRILGSVIWIYLRCLASFGLYAFVWLYRQARGVGGRDRAGAFAWATGSIAAPIACLVLYDLSARARSELNAAGRWGLPPWVAPGLYACIAISLLYGPLRFMWSPIWLLMPIPLAIVHGQLQRAQRCRHAGSALGPSSTQSTPAAEVVRSRAWGWRAAEAVAVVLGVGFVAYATQQIDGMNAAILFGEIESGRVSGTSASYHLTIDGEEWRRVATGSIGDDSSDIELVSVDQSSWLIVYVHQEGNSIDDVVDARYDLVASDGSLNAFEEERFFLLESEDVPVSAARYRVGTSQLVQGEYVVSTMKLDTGVVEAVAFTLQVAERSGELQAILRSLKPAHDAPMAKP